MATHDALVMRTTSISHKNDEALNGDLPEVVVVTNSMASESDKPEGLNGSNERIGSPDSGSVMVNEHDKSVVVSNPSLISDLQEKVNLSWEDICVEAELPKPSLLKRLFKKEDVANKPTKKQILFDGKYISSILHILLFTIQTSLRIRSIEALSVIFHCMNAASRPLEL